MADEIYVVKRNGRGKEKLDINKIHDMMQHACEVYREYHHHKFR